MFFACCCAEEESAAGAGVRLEVAIRDQTTGEGQVEAAKQPEPSPTVEEAAAAPAPAAPGAVEPGVFNVVVFRNTESFGIDVSAADKVCMVNDVAPDSLLGKWNDTCESDRQIRKTDRLFAINGQTFKKAKDALGALKTTSGEITLTFQRATLNKVTLSTDGCPLGLSLKDGPNFLLVLDVFEGAVETYNNDVPSEKQLRNSSRIIKVDGVAGAGDEMLKVISSRIDAKQRELEFLTW
eukprot:TRINITY_DN907_c0_g1_i1.p2 TRINITY_DN907_c0_g1~~TRINITY_DN907_c0_g1_i1.p2  ORF type:complete len:238 (+),score=56.65 TRINITY_DN907_c0_g1_i1:88-801(+)